MSLEDFIDDELLVNIQLLLGLNTPQQAIQIIREESWLAYMSAICSAPPPCALLLFNGDKENPRYCIGRC
jgi:hypothetical protein